MRVALGADHAGVDLKDALKPVLDSLGIAYEDFGTAGYGSVDYPDYARAVAEGVSSGRFDRGVLVCGSGIGMAIAANKVPGIRAAVVHNVALARLCRQHNDANVITLGARVTEAAVALDILREFLATAFDCGRHAARVGKIRRIEESVHGSRGTHVDH